MRIIISHNLGYFYRFWGVIICGSLHFVTVFVWRGFLVVFLVPLAAQRAVRYTVNVGVKEGNFSDL